MERKCNENDADECTRNRWEHRTTIIICLPLLLLLMLFAQDFSIILDTQ